MRPLLLVLMLAAGTAHAGVTVTRFTVTGAKPRQTSATPQKQPKAAQGNGCQTVRVNATIDGKTVALCVQKNRWSHTAATTRFTATSMPDKLLANGFDPSKLNPRRKAP